MPLANATTGGKRALRANAMPEAAQQPAALRVVLGGVPRLAPPLRRPLAGLLR